MSHQQSLSFIAVRDGYTFESYYVSKANRECVDALSALSQANVHQQYAIWGDTQVGKSHLLQAVCHRCLYQQVAISYFPLRELKQYGTRVLDGHELSHILVLDDIDLLAGDSEWEDVLLRLVDHSHRQTLLVSSTKNPMQVVWQSPDLAARLMWGAIYQLQSLSDDDKVEALQYRAQQRGFSLPPNVIDFINKRYPRDFDSLMKILDKLDEESLAQKKALTLPFVKEILLKI